MNLENRNASKKFKRFGVIVLVLLFTSWLVNAIVESFKVSEEQLPSTYTLTPEDSSLIAPSHRKGMKVLEVRRSIVRDNISFLSIDGEYVVAIHKLRLIPNIALSTATQLEQVSVTQTNNITYFVVSLANWKYSYKAGIPAVASHIYLTASGESSVRLINSLTKVAYSLKARNLSLRYNADSPIDIYMESKGGFLRTKVMPIQLMLVKRIDAVYFIVLMSDTEKPLPKDDLILDIIN